MKKKKNSQVKNRRKHANIPLRRRLILFYSKLLLILKVLLVIFVVVFCFTKFFAEVKHEIIQNIYRITEDMGFTLKNVVIEGQNNVRESELLEAINANIGESVFALDLTKIRDDLRKGTWIKEVYVGRRLPSSLYIRLFERIPIAIWQINHQLFLIDKEGYKITQNITNFSHLLQVVGPNANIYAGKLVEELRKYPDIASRTTSAIRYGDRRWDLNLQEHITVKMSSSAFEVSLKYIDSLNKANKLFGQNYKTLDLRDNEKYYLEKY